jgi:hypothetical protein
VSLLNVDDEELRPILVLLVKSVERGNLPPEGRSGIAAEYQDDGPLTPELGELNGGFLVVSFQRKVGSLLANSKAPASGIEPHGLEREDDEDGARSPGHDRTEGFGLATHGEEEPAQEEHIGRNQDEY